MSNRIKGNQNDQISVGKCRFKIFSFADKDSASAWTRQWKILSKFYLLEPGMPEHPVEAKENEDEKETADDQREH